MFFFPRVLFYLILFFHRTKMFRVVTLFALMAMELASEGNKQGLEYSLISYVYFEQDSNNVSCGIFALPQCLQPLFAVEF